MTGEGARTMRRVIWPLMMLLTLFATTMHADGGASDTPSEPREGGIPIQQIETALKSYAEAVGCQFRFDKNNVAPFHVERGRPRTFVALFRLDPGCAGGNGMAETMVALLHWGGLPKDEIFVDPAASGPAAQAFGFPAVINRVFVKGNQVSYSGMALDLSKDAPCCPSVPVEGQIVVRKGLVKVEAGRTLSAWYWLSVPER
jgi:hypothetical protein